MVFQKGHRPPSRAPEPAKSWAEHLEANSDAIFRKVVQLAKKGEASALRLAMHQLTPRTRVVRFALPEIHAQADILPALRAVSKAASDGLLSPEEASAFGELIGAYQSAFEQIDIGKRLEELERFVRERLQLGDEI
jgi:hypothetical protein